MVRGISCLLFGDEALALLESCEAKASLPCFIGSLFFVG